MNKDYIAAFILPTQLTESEKTKKFLKAYFPSAFKRFDINKDKYVCYKDLKNYFYLTFKDHIIENTHNALMQQSPNLST